MDVDGDALIVKEGDHYELPSGPGLSDLLGSWEIKMFSLGTASWSLDHNRRSSKKCLAKKLIISAALNLSSILSFVT